MADLRASRQSGEPAQTGGTDMLDLGAVGVLEHAGKRFAVNLLWLTIDDPNVSFGGQKELMAARRALIKPDFICERSQIIGQQGYGHLSKGHRVGMPAAAAQAADLLVGEWHGIFAAENGWWYVAVHGDAIAPEGDRFFTSEESAYQHFMEAMNQQRWPRSYAPKEWAIASTNHDITLAKLLDGLPSVYLKPYTLDSLFGNTTNKYISLSALTFVIFMFVTFFATGLSNYMSAPLQPQRAMVANVTDPLVVPPRPSTKFLDQDQLLEITDYPPPVLVRICLDKFQTMFRSLPGWKQVKISCVDGNVRGEWLRSGARIADLANLRRYFSKDVTMTYDGQGRLMVTEPLDLSKVEKVKMQINHKEILYAMLATRLESKGEMKISETTITPPVATPTPGVAAPDPSQAAAPERFLSVDFKTPLAAYLWADDFDIPGMKPVELIWSIPESAWSLTGLIKYQ